MACKTKDHQEPLGTCLKSGHQCNASKIPTCMWNLNFITVTTVTPWTASGSGAGPTARNTRIASEFVKWHSSHVLLLSYVTALRRTVCSLIAESGQDDGRLCTLSPSDSKLSLPWHARPQWKFKYEETITLNLVTHGWILFQTIRESARASFNKFDLRLSVASNVRTKGQHKSPDMWKHMQTDTYCT